MTPLPPLSATAPALVTPPPRWWARLLDRLSIYLPVLLMGGLALGSYWLVRNAPAPAAPVEARPPSHEPDYFMQRFAVRSFAADGQLLNELRGRELRHYPDTRSLEVDEARARTYNAQGRLTTLRSEWLGSNADQSVYQLRGAVQVVRDSPASAGTPSLEFQGEALTVDDARDLITADRPVQLRRGDDRITADTLRYDDRQRLADFQGRVRATLAPRP